jgi:hypothetical protein
LNCRIAALTAELRSPVPLDDARAEESRDEELREDVDLFVDLDRDDEDADALDRPEPGRDPPPEPLSCPLAAAIPLPIQRAARASTAPDLGGVPRPLWD